MRRLVCVVEGHGELVAAPVLCHRVIRKLLSIDDWYVDEEAVRQPRGRLVDASKPSPRRGVNVSGLNKALELAGRRPGRPEAVLVMCDADDDCPAAWGSTMPRSFPIGAGSVAVGGVMANREYESWLL